MRVRFWGTRGSIPTPGPDTVRYGGNTPCVEVRTDDGTLLILDCGTGVRRLGLELARSGPVRAHVLITHTHADHIQGLPFFVPAFQASSHLTIFGPAGIDRSLSSAVGGLMDYAYFPLPIQDLPSRVEFVEIGEGEFSIGEVRVCAQELNHTSPCLGYRLEAGGAVLVYATDHEPHANPLWRSGRQPSTFQIGDVLHAGDARHVELLRDADLVIHDAQYTTGEYPVKKGWGHSTIEYVVDVALAARARRLALFHHDPLRTDDAMDNLLETSRGYAEASSIPIELFAAAEGLEIVIDEQPRARASEATPRAPQVPAQVRILVADDDDSVAALLEHALRRDGYEVVRARSGSDVVELARAYQPDLVLLDIAMPELDGLAACRALRAERFLKRMPIVILTARDDEAAMVQGFAEGATDYIAKPFAVAQVRARVRSWLTRTAVTEA